MSLPSFSHHSTETLAFTSRLAFPTPPPATSMARRARVAGDIQGVDGVIETAKLGGPEPSFYSAPALVFRAGGGDVGVRITL